MESLPMTRYGWKVLATLFLGFVARGARGILKKKGKFLDRVVACDEMQMNYYTFEPKRESIERNRVKAETRSSEGKMLTTLFVWARELKGEGGRGSSIHGFLVRTSEDQHNLLLRPSGSN
ncbi:hypothetical protein Trydic_g19097 [Trypoxylus dichotomus]